MNEEKCCRNCSHYPCMKEECDINNRKGCEQFKGIIASAIEIIDKCNKE